MSLVSVVCQAGEGTAILRVGMCSVGDGSGVGGATGCAVAAESSWAVVASGEDGFVSGGDKGFPCSSWAEARLRSCLSFARLKGVRLTGVRMHTRAYLFWNQT